MSYLLLVVDCTRIKCATIHTRTVFRPTPTWCCSSLSMIQLWNRAHKIAIFHLFALDSQPLLRTLVVYSNAMFLLSSIAQIVQLILTDTCSSVDFRVAVGSAPPQRSQHLRRSSPRWETLCSVFLFPRC